MTMRESIAERAGARGDLTRPQGDTDGQYEMVNTTKVSRAPGSQGLRDCAREYLIFRCASCYSIFSRVLGNQFARPKFGHTYAQSRLRHGRMHGRRDARRTRRVRAVVPRAYARRRRGRATRGRAPARPCASAPAAASPARRRGARQGRARRTRGAATTPAAPGRERGTNSIDATTRLAGRDAGRDETAWPIRLLQSAIDRDRANSYPGALTCTSRGVIILWSGTRDPTRRGAFWYRTRSPFRFVFGRAGDPQIRRSRCARQSP